MKTRHIFYLLLLIPLISSCGSSKQSQKQIDRIGDILGYAYKFKGTPYRAGGTSPKGFDCSGYVQYVFKEFNYNLPRTTTDQSKEGQKVDRQDIRAGDLVFFKGRDKRSKKVGHVGIVTSVDRHGNFRFIHASSSKGIVETSISELYYKDRYITARRIV